MLYVIGTGLWKWDDISVRGLEASIRARRVYIDGYTRKFEDAELEKLEERVGKKIIRLGRHELEEGLGFLKEAESEDVALLVPGDPLVATTHITIVSEAGERGIAVEIIHGSSIYTALIGEAGLHIYKFGGSCTIPMREKRIRPYSVYEKIRDNAARGLHTLVFLDTTPEREMDVGEALGIMQEIEGERKEEVFSDGKKIVAGCRLGSGEQRIIYAEIRKLANMEFKGPCTLIYPGKLHFTEEEFLGNCAGDAGESP